MTAEQKKAKILSAIESRGWYPLDIYPKEATELKLEGKIKWGTNYFTGGNRKIVWVKA